jgi:hypothetical protein
MVLAGDTQCVPWMHTTMGEWRGCNADIQVPKQDKASRTTHSAPLGSLAQSTLGSLLHPGKDGLLLLYG